MSKEFIPMILVYSKFINPRIAYTFETVFHTILGSHVNITLNKTDFENYHGPKLNYSDITFKGVQQFYPHHLLNEEHIEVKEIKCFSWGNMPVFFKTNNKSIWPFDPFAMIFYLISRYEEYQTGIRLDEHSRFDPKQSIAYKNGFLTFPVVDYLIIKMRDLLLKQYPQLEFKTLSYQHIPSFDIDKLFSYKALPLHRTIGGLGKDLLNFRFQKAKERIAVLSGITDDPFDNLDELIAICKKGQDIKPICFINFGKHSKYDKNNSSRNTHFIKTLEEIQQKTKIGIHPSYYTNKYPSKLEKEIKLFSKQFGFDASISRQHFIMLNLPKTYRMLSFFNIKEDYSMGYASEIGFRASTSHAFHFYDLKKKEKSDLLIHPFVCMDGTFFDYMNLKETEALEKIANIQGHLRKVGGGFISIWHHSYIANKKLKLKFFEDVIKVLSSNQ